MKRHVILLSLLFFTSLGIKAQTVIPFDPAVRHGKLDNGLTYYIRHNNKPEGRASFYLAQKVGSMQEEENQKGLAHFLEHMAFSSTKNFPDKVTDVLQARGVSMGRNINAYTSYDQTVYYLKDIPLENTGLMDTCLLILHDWCGFISLKDEDIERERKVIKEEWRMRNSAGSRIWEQKIKDIFAGTKYEDRSPIGDMDIVENFKYEELRDYYKTWYRPDLQGIIVVGNVDVDEVEAKIKTMFADIPVPVNPAERIYYPVPGNETPIISIITDPEETRTNIDIYIKHDKAPEAYRQTPEYIKDRQIISLATTMLSGRFSEIGHKPDAPFNNAYAYYGNFQVSGTKEILGLGASVKEGKAEETMDILLTEAERVKQFGFTDSEIERAKVNMLKSYENQYNNRNTQDNSQYVNVLLNGFLTNQPVPEIAYSYSLMNEFLPAVTKEQIDQKMRMLLTDNNIIVTLTGPQKEELVYPEDIRIKELLTEAKGQSLTPYEEDLPEGPLVASLPAPGKIVKEERNEKYDFTEWTLSNGMKVVFKKTNFRDDGINMGGTAYGGTSVFEDHELLNARYASSVPGIGGVGNFNTQQLRKVLAGKTASVNPGIGAETVSMGGYSTKADLPVMFELLHLYFTAPRKDEEAFEAFKNRVKNSLLNKDSNPDTRFNDSIRYAVNGDNPRVFDIRLEDVDKLDYDRMIEMYKISFTNPGSFVLNFSGTIEEEEFRPLVEKYLASLPSGNREMQYVKRNKELRKGNYVSRFIHKAETPKASVYVLYNGTLQRSETQAYRIHVMNQLLGEIFRRTMRGDEGGVYGVRSNFDIRRVPEGQAVLSVSFSTDPNRVDELVPIIHRELKLLAENGPLDEEFKKSREAILNNYESYQQMDGYWNAILNIFYFYGEDENGDTDYRNQITSVTKEEIQQLAKDLLSQENMVEVVMINE